MKAVIHVKNAAHQRDHAGWMKAGLERHGVTVELAPREQPMAADLVVIWGWRHPLTVADAQRRGVPILVMERGHVQPRMELTSCGFNGLGRRGVYPKAADGGERWRRLFAPLERDWIGDAQTRAGYALLCGQVPGDAALASVDFLRWAQVATDKLRGAGHHVVYRPHPMVVRNGSTWCPAGAEFSTRALGDDLAGAALAVTYNSTSGVECVLAGVPTVTCDEGAMAWPVASHLITDRPMRLDRTQWMHDLAWTSWRPEEIERGDTWEALRTCLH